jgi:SnoaL-like protein
MNESQLAERWVDAWNRRELRSLLDLYADDAEFVSPFVTLLASVRGASLRGKPALRAHFEASWTAGPGGRMEIEEIHPGEDELTFPVRGGCADRMEMAFQLDSAGRIYRSTSRILSEVSTGGAA